MVTELELYVTIFLIYGNQIKTTNVIEYKLIIMRNIFTTILILLTINSFSEESIDTVVSTHKTIVIRWDCNSELTEVTAGWLTDIHVNFKQRQAVINHIPKGDTVYIISQWDGDICTDSPIDIIGAEALPIELLNFKDGSFETASEINSWYFEIQIFRGGVIWETVETIYAKGASVYTFDSSETGYYRLVAYDDNGYIEIFNSIYIDADKAALGVPGTGAAVATGCYGPVEIALYADGEYSKIVKN